ncbi:MAG: hypothetical protein ACHQXA_04210 [Gemmatimonadales bacterium]
MRTYWIKIVAGALGIFALGLVAIFAFRKVTGGVNQLVHGTGDVNIPLLGFVPFSIAGRPIGNLRTLQIHRDAPKHVTGFRLVTRLDDSVDSDRFDECFFTLTDASRINEHTTFACVDSIPPGMREFGDVQFVDSEGDEDLSRPIVLSEQDIADFQNANDHGAVRITVNDDSIRTAADSMATASRRMGDSIRREVQARYGRRSGGTVYSPTRPDPPAGPKPPAKAAPSPKP